MIKVDISEIEKTVIQEVIVDGEPKNTVKVGDDIIYLRTNMYQLKYLINNSGVYGRHFGAGYVNLHISYAHNDTDTKSADWYLFDSYIWTGLTANYHYHREWDSNKGRAKWSREIYSYDQYGNIIPRGTYEWYDDKKYTDYDITVYILTSPSLISGNKTCGEEFCIGTAVSDDRGQEAHMPQTYTVDTTSVCGAVRVQKDESSTVDTILSLGANREPPDEDKILVSNDKKYTVSPFTSTKGRFNYFEFQI